MNKQLRQEINAFYDAGIPFFFLLDFEGKQGEIIPLDRLSQDEILYAYPSGSNAESDFPQMDTENIQWQIFPVSFDAYQKQFDIVHEAIRRGDSYLLNLSISTPVKTNLSLKEIFFRSSARYKLWYKNKFVHFSPETFIRIQGKEIDTFPMKGTIDAARPNAKEQILQDKKEKAEQYIITDLLRNDLSLVASDVKVKRFRYIDEVQTNQKKLLQVSSHICGQLKAPFAARPGDVFDKILPAGSICGAPKKKTLELIHHTETHDRGYYTGVWGIFDGKQLDSCIIIRYLEKGSQGFNYKSGGGITAMSEVRSEYKEIIDKIYVPIF